MHVKMSATNMPVPWSPGTGAGIVAYAVLLSPAAEREWRKLPRDIRPRVNRALLALEDTPRPAPDGLVVARSLAAA